jgi:hypothetical protein
MKIKLCICSETTATELLAVTALCNILAMGKSAHVASGTPTISADDPLGQIEEPGDNPTPGETVHVPAGNDKPKRTRRAKAEAEVEKGPFYWSHPESDSFGEVATRAELDGLLAGDQCVCEVTKADYDKLVADKAAAGNEAPAPTPTAPETTSGVAETPVSASPSKDYTEAEVQDLAGKVARGVGPEVVKDKIAALGASRIAELTQEQRNDLGAFLTGKLS